MDDLAAKYAEAKPLLQAHLQGEDIFVASMFVMVKGGSKVSYATWTDGVESVLPVAPLLALVDLGSGAMRVLDFERAMRLCPEFQLFEFQGLQYLRVPESHACLLEKL
jgi:hypothetical protein